MQGQCKPTPCTNCNTCISAMNTFAATQLTVTNSAAVAEQFYTTCVNQNRSAALCSQVQNAIKSSQQGNAGKRPAMLCRMLGECKAAANSSSCIVQVPASTTGNATVVALNQLSMCSATGAPGALVTGISSNSSLPAGRCRQTSDCPAAASGAAPAYRCSMAAARRMCMCSGSGDAAADSCYDHGACILAECGRCSEW
jgi:hypothetical protein